MRENRPTVLRELTEDELAQKIKSLQEEMFNLRFRNTMKQLDNPLKIRESRREMARLLGIHQTRHARREVFPGRQIGNPREWEGFQPIGVGGSQVVALGDNFDAVRPCHQAYQARRRPGNWLANSYRRSRAGSLPLCPLSTRKRR